MFHNHALAAEILAVQLVNGVVGVAGVLELHEAVPGSGARAGTGVAPLGRGRARTRGHRHPRALPRPRVAAILEALPRGAAALAAFSFLGCPATATPKALRGEAGAQAQLTHF